MDKKRVITKLCDLSTKVGSDVFGSKVPHDCFCGGPVDVFGFQFSEQVIKFIEDAVNEKILRDICDGHM